MLTSFFPFPIFVCVNSMQQKLGQNQHEFHALLSFTKRWQRKRESPNLSYKAPEKEELLWVSTVTWQKFWKRTELQLERLSVVGFRVRGFDCTLSKWYFWKKFLLPQAPGSSYINLQAEGSFRVDERSFILHVCKEIWVSCSLTHSKFKILQYFENVSLRK